MCDKISHQDSDHNRLLKVCWHHEEKGGQFDGCVNEACNSNMWSRKLNWHVWNYRIRKVFHIMNALLISKEFLYHTIQF
jgi:hypothetical protein